MWLVNNLREVILTRKQCITVVPGINGAVNIENGAYSHTPASHIVTTNAPSNPPNSGLDAYDEDETEDEDMVGGTIYDSPKRDSITANLSPADDTDGPRSPSPVPPTKHEFHTRPSTAIVSSRGNRIMSEDETSAADEDADGEVEVDEHAEEEDENQQSEGDEDDGDDATQPEYKDSADEEDYEDDDDLDLEEMDDDEDEDFDMGGKKSKKKGKSTKRGGSGSERPTKKGRESSASSKCEFRSSFSRR